MKRRTLDRIATIAGLAVAAVLVIAGSLLTWAHNFVGDEVRTQLSAQQIYFPARDSPAIAAPEFAPMRKYAGQQLKTGSMGRPSPGFRVELLDPVTGEPGAPEGEIL